MYRSISVFIKEPGKNPRHVHISASNHNLQKIVGGQITALALSSDMGILYNKEQKAMQPCFSMFGKDFNGTIIFCGLSSLPGQSVSEWIDVPINFKRFKALFPTLWEQNKKG